MAFWVVIMAFMNDDRTKLTDQTKKTPKKKPLQASQPVDK